MMGAQRWLSRAVAPMAVTPSHRCKGLVLLLGSLTAPWWCTLHPGVPLWAASCGKCTTSCQPVGLQPSAYHTPPTLPDTACKLGSCSRLYTLSPLPSASWCAQALSSENPSRLATFQPALERSPACRDSLGEEQQRAASPQSRDSTSHTRSQSLAEVLSSEQPSSLRIMPVRPSSAHSLMRPGLPQPHWYSPQPGGRGSADGTPGSPAPSLASVATCPPSLARDGLTGDDVGGMHPAEAGHAAEAGWDRTPGAGLLGQKRPSGMLLPPHEEDRKFPLKRLFEGLHEMQLGKEQSTTQQVHAPSCQVPARAGCSQLMCSSLAGPALLS